MSKLHCCVPGCNADKRYDRENKLSFHRFPPHSKKELRDGWVNNIRRDTDNRQHESVLPAFQTERL